MTNGEITTNEIMEFLQENMVTREEFTQKLDEQGRSFTQKLNSLKLDIIDKMDDKLADLRGDLVIMTRKEDKKVTALVDILETKKILTEKEAATISSLGLFPK